MKRRLSYDQFVQRRARRVFFLLAFAYLLLAGRLFYIQVIRAPHFHAKAEELIVARIKIFAKRGTIYDRNGNKLATTVEAYDIGVRPSAMEDKSVAASKLAPLLGKEASEILTKLNSRDTFFYMARKVDAEVGVEIRKAGILGVEVLRTTKRVYPGGSLASHIIGYTNVDGEGIAGLEKVFDAELRGRDGYTIAERDARGRLIPGRGREHVDPIHGKDLVLTIDSTIQHALETELEKSYSTHSAVGASAVVMDPKTGEIVALANMPTFDPNKIGESDDASRRNRAITDLYEPGSTLKTMTACAALEEGVVKTTDIFHCKGSMQIGRRTIRCSLHPPFMAGHGACDTAKILRYSCNMGAATMGLKLGKEKLYEYEQAFGLYEKPGTEMLGEVRGWYSNWKDWSDIQLTNIAFGQGIAVTPLQMARAYCVVANGGNLMKPYVVREIRLPDGTTEQTFEPEVVRRVVSEGTADLVAGMLQSVVDDGTGKPAQVDGYRVGGKTGSAQKASTTGRGYVPGKFIASFAGFLPISDPRLVIIVAVDEPKGTHWGATVAAPVFQGVARRAMWHMRVPPDQLPQDPSPVAGESGREAPRKTEPRPSNRPQLGG